MQIAISTRAGLIIVLISLASLACVTRWRINHYSQLTVELARLERLQLDTTEAWIRLRSVPSRISDEIVAVVYTNYERPGGGSIGANGCAITSTGLVVTVAHSQGDVESTCSVWGNTTDKRGFRSVYRVMWRDVERDLALLMPDRPLTATIRWHRDIATWRRLRMGDAVSLTTVANLHFSDVDTSASCARHRGWGGLFRMAHVVVAFGFNAMLDCALAPGGSGTPVFDRSGTLCGLVNRGKQTEPGSIGSSSVTMLGQSGDATLLRDAESSGTLFWKSNDQITEVATTGTLQI